MDNFAADFIIDLTEPLQAEFDLTQEEPINCTFEVYASGTVWGSISGDINNQTDLIELIENNYNDLEGQITTLDTKVDNNYNELSNGLIEANQDILDLTNTVNSNYTTLNNKIDEINIDLSADISELNTNIQNEAATRAENDTLLQNNINTLSDTVTANYNTLDGKIDTEISNRTIADTTLQNNINAEVLARQNADTTLQGNINTLSGTVTSNYNALDARITTNTGNISDINTTLSGYGNIVTHNVSEFATSAQGALANTALQPNDNISELVNDVGYITSASLPTDYVPETRTINGFALSSNITLNYTDVGALSASTTINDLTTTAQQNALNSGATTTNIGQIATNTGNITAINEKIPSQASSSNQLADKDFVNSSIATNTANFIGTFNSVAELEAYTGTLTNNDYAFVATTDAAGNTLYDRYKYNADTQEWLFEYELNNSSFTAAQWESINSGATSTNIGQITTNANNIADLQTNKQDVLTAGANVQINNNVISATDTTYTAGTGISIVNGVISNTQTSAEWGNITGTLSNQTDLQNALDLKADISSLATVATSGSYNDLLNKPTIPTVNNATLTIQKNGTTVQTFTANASSNVTANITVPTDTSDLTNNAGFITGITSGDVTTALGYTPYNSSNPSGYISSASISTLTDVDLTSLSDGQTLTYDNANSKWVNATINSATWGNITGTLSNQTDLQNALDDKQATLVSGTNIKTINGQSVLGSGNLQTPYRNIGEIVASTIPLTDAGLHLLDGSLIQGDGIYSDFVNYMANVYKTKDRTYTPSAFTITGSPTITSDGVASGFSSSNRLVSTINIPNTYNKLEILSPIYNMENNSDTENYVVSYANAFTFSSIYGLVAIRAYNVTEGRFCLFRNYTGVVRPSVGDIVQGKIVYENNTCTAYYKNITTGSDWIPLGRQEGATSPTTPFPMSGVMNIGAQGSNQYYKRGWIDLKQFSITVDGKEVFSGSTPAKYFTDETTWQASISQYGVCGKFVYDSTNNTVRLPKITGILEGTTDVNALGDLVKAGLPNITGELRPSKSNNDNTSTHWNLGYGSGAFSINSGLVKREPNVTSANRTDVIGATFDASRSSSIYGNSSTVQPQTIKVLYYIVIATTTKTEIEVDIDEIATDLNGKADVDLSNTNNQAKILMSGMGMPSNKFINLTLGASGSTYTAPANGYFVLYKIASGGNQYIQMVNDGYNNVSATCMTIRSVANGDYVGCTIPCAKGKQIHVLYTLGGNTMYFRFCYAVGSEGEV